MKKLVIVSSLLVSLVSACAPTGSTSSSSVPGSRAYDGAPCADENEPGRLCANPVDRCPGGGLRPSRETCVLGTWRCLRDPIGSCDSPTSDAGQPADVQDAAVVPDHSPVADPEGCYDLGQDPNPGFSCTPGCWYVNGSSVPYHGPPTMSGTCFRTCLVSGQLSDCSNATPDAGTTGECTVGETRHCYSGPAGTEGIGQCHGATQVCRLGVDGQAHWPSPIDCVTEVTPNPVETPYDGIDNDCNGWVDDDQRLHAGHTWTCVASRGCYWFGNAPDSRWDPAYGFQGCYTSGSFPPAGDGAIGPGHLISANAQRELHQVYYLASNGRRYVFPTATTLGSWFMEPGGTGNIMVDAQACANVLQVTDAQLAAIHIGGNVTMRPGTVFTGITTDPARYAISRHGTLRRMNIGGLTLAPTWYMGPRIVLVPDAFFVNYQVGTGITDTSQYDSAAEYSATIEQDLGIAP